MNCKSVVKTPGQIPRQLHICCKKCDNSVGMNTLLVLLSNSRLLKETFICKGSQDTPNDSLDIQNFKKWLESITKKDSVVSHSKAKKIKKRGRKKWTSKHDLILEGSIILLGDSISKIQKLLPEFNENVIRKKLSHVLWKNYAISKPENSMQICSEIDEEQKFEDDEVLSFRQDEFHTFFTYNENQFSQIHDKASDSKVRSGLKSLNQNSNFNFTLGKINETHNENSLDNLSCLKKMYIESIADLSNVLEDNDKMTNDFKFQEARRLDQMYYQNSAVNINSLEKL